LDTVNKIEKTDKNAPIKVGCNENLMETLDKHAGVGESGIKTMVIEVNNQKTAYVLFDSNNMETGFRGKTMKACKNLEIDELELMTTDTHSVNTLSNGYNPIGLTEQDEIIEYTKTSIKKAIEDLEEVEAGIITKRIKGLNTFGPNNSTELVSTISSIVAVSKVIAPIIFILAVIFVFIWIFFFS
jgi:putative membrane protein